LKGIIIGGGIIGLSIARELNKLGYEITILEKNLLGRGASWAAGGMLAPQAEGLTGNFLNFAVESREMYKDFVKQLEKETGNEVSYYECGIVCPAFSEKEMENLSKRVDYYKELGLESKILTRQEILDMGIKISSFVIGGAFFPQDKQVDNRKLVISLVKYVKNSNITVKEFTEVKFIEADNGIFQRVITNNGAFEADFCILAAGAWSGEIEPIKVFPVKGQMLSFKTKTKNEISKILYSSRAYIIPRKDSNLVVVGATQENVFFKEGNTVSGIFSLLKGLLETLPSTKDYEITETWYGFRPATPDGLPILGKSEIKNLYYATGHFRNGILLAPITAKLITQLIHKGEESRYLKMFDFSRFYIKEE
jgi:glycine oxidase ThiO